MIAELVEYRLNSVEDNFTNYLFILNALLLIILIAGYQFFLGLKIGKTPKNQERAFLSVVLAITVSVLGSTFLFAAVSVEVQNYLKHIYGKQYGVYLNSDGRVYLYNNSAQEYFKDSQGEVLLALDKHETIEKGKILCAKSLKACNKYLVEHKTEILNKFQEQQGKN